MKNSMFLAFSVTVFFFLSCNKDEIVAPEEQEMDIVNPQSWPVNDTRFYAANEADIWINSFSGIMYAVYPENSTGYYETRGRIGMSIFSLATPWKVKNIEVCKTGDLGVLGNPIVAYLSPIVTGEKLRVFVVCDGYEKLIYRDFDLTTEEFGDWKNVQFNNSDFTAQTINNLINADGANIENSSEFIKVETLYGNSLEGYTYQMFTTGERAFDRKAIFRSKDNFASVEYVGLFPYEVRFDSIMTQLSGMFYFLFRKGHTNGLSDDAGVYLTTTNDFTTYTTPVRVGSMDMRPDIFTKDNYVFLVVGDKRDQGEGFYRTNAHILKGQGASLDGYSKVVSLTDNRGVVNPRARLFGTDYHFMYSSSPIRLDMENGYYSPVNPSAQYQGKECVCYYRVRMD